MLVCATPGLKTRGNIVELLLKNNACVNAHSKYVSYTDPYLSPLSEYLRCNDSDIDYNVVFQLVKYGAKVSFRGYLSIVRLKDPFGALQYWKAYSEKQDIKRLLIESATSFDLPSIKSTGPGAISNADNEHLVHYASRPRELKHIVRLFLRDSLQPNFPSKVSELPLPNLLKSYLLFEV